jgi:hypothetical protein
LAKDKNENLTEKQRVDILMRGIRSLDASIVAAKTDVYKDNRSDFNAATNFLSGLVSNFHVGAQLDYAGRHSGKKRYVSAVDSSDGRGGRGRARRGGGWYGQQHGSGRGGRSRRDSCRNGRACGSGRGDRRIRMNNVDVTDPHLGAARAYVQQLQNNSTGRGSGRDGGGRGTSTSGRSTTEGQRNASSTTVTNNNEYATQAGEQSVVLEIMERGSQNGRSFGRGAYTS